MNENHPVAEEARRLGIQYVACGLCGDPTTKTATRRCDRCWELESRIQAEPELARKILAQRDLETTQNLSMNLAKVEKMTITRAMSLFDNSIIKTAKALGISRTTLWRRLKHYGVVDRHQRVH